MKHISNLFWLVCIFIIPIIFLLTSCVPTAIPDSDTGYTWSGYTIPVDTSVYSVTVRVNGTMVNHTETNAIGSLAGVNTYTSGSYRMWQEGKGLLPVQVISITPDFIGVKSGDFIVLKTTDLKAMALPENAITEFLCNKDIEVLSPMTSNQKLTVNRYTYELDTCRMLLPTYRFDSGR